MAHNTSKLAKSLDFINRDLFEWLMHPLNNYRRYQAKYLGNYAGARYFTRVFFTALFTVIPVIPALYVLSRTATLFSEVRANPIKTFFMAAVAGGIAAELYFFVSYGTLPAILTPAVGVVATVLTTVGLSLPPVAVAAIVLGAGLSIIGALGFYVAKSVAQTINSRRFNGLISTSKHQLPVSKNAEDNIQPFQNVYNDMLLKQKVLKEMAVTVPAEDMHNEIIETVDENTSLPFGKTLEGTLEEGKQLLAGLESIVAESHQRTLELEAYESVLGVDNSVTNNNVPSGLFHSYLTNVSSIDNKKVGNKNEDNLDLDVSVSRQNREKIVYQGYFEVANPKEQKKITTRSSGNF